MPVNTDQIAESMYKLVQQAHGMKKLKAMDLIKSMLEMYGDEVDKKMCKEAIKKLIESERCVYTYFGGSYIELPHRESAAND